MFEICKNVNMKKQNILIINFPLESLHYWVSYNLDFTALYSIPLLEYVALSLLIYWTIYLAISNYDHILCAIWQRFKSR